MRKFLCMMLVLLTMGMSGFAQTTDTVIIGTGTSASYTLPFNNYFKNSWAQMIYPASQIEMAGYITSISFYVAAVPASNYPFSTLNIYMGLSQDSVINSTSGWLPMSELTEVYSATNLASPTATGWQTFTLSTPFPYDGSSNLVIVTSKTMATYSMALTYRYTAGGTSTCLYRQNDSDASYAQHPGTVAGTQSVNRPNLRLTINVSEDFCYPVSNLAVSNLMTNQCTVSWNGVQNSNGYILQYKMASQPWGSATTVDVYDTTYDLTGLVGPMDYNVRVASNCGDDTSFWKTTSFHTPCTPISTLPLTDDFDAYTGSTSGATNNLPYCWSYLNTATSSTSSYIGYPIVYASATYAASGSNSLRFYTYTTTGTYGDQMVILPPIDPTLYPVNSLQLTFDARNYSSYTFTAVVGVITNPSDMNTFVPVDTIVTTSNTYANYEIPFSQYTGPEGFIAIMAPKPTSSYNAGYIDNIMVDLIPTCPKPKNIASSNATLSSIDLTWTEMGSATAWDIEYGPTGFTPGDGTVTSVSTNPCTLNNLESSTVYDFYVRANCGGGDVSYYSNVHTAGTACSPVSILPFTDNLDGYTGTTGTDASSANLPYCWNKLNAGTSYAGLPNIYNSTTYAASGSNSVRFYTYTSSTYDDQILVLPEFDPSLYPMSNLQLTLDARNSGSYTFTLEVGVMTDPTVPTTFVPVDTIETTSNLYMTYDIPMSQYTGTGSYIAVKAPKPTSSYNAGYIDNLVVEVIPTCARPKDLTASNPTVSSIDLSWTEMGNATSWEIEYGPMGFTPGMGTVEPATSNPFTLNGLNHSTGYDFYVRATCSSSDHSHWSNLCRAGTACAPIDNLPLTESFDAYIANTSTTDPNLPYCWNKLNTGTTYAGLPNIYNSSTSAASGNNSLRFYTYNTTSTSTSSYGDQIAILPQIDVDIYPMNTLQISFDARDNTATYPFHLVVGVMTDPTDQTTFVPVDTVTTSSTAYANYIVTLDSYTGTGSYIALFAEKPDNTAVHYNYGYVDNIVVEVIPTCPRPTALTATSQLTDEVLLSWTDENASLWDVLYGPVGFDPDDASQGTLVSGVSNPHTVSGLTAGVYDFYVRANCGDGDVSTWTIVPVTSSPYTYTMGVTGTDTVSGCSFTIADNGGIAGDYGNNCQFTLVVYPGEADSVVSISGTFVGETTVDYLSVYNGSAVDENNLLQKIVSGTTGTLINFGPLTSTTGPLTLLFHSDGSVVRDGFVAQVSCVEAPSCPKPFDVLVSGVTNSEATVSWNVLDGAATSFNIVMSMTPNFNPDTCSNVLTINSMDYTFYDLLPYTNYYVSVQTDCGGDVSEWTSLTGFRTACDPIVTLPFSENFDSSTGATTTSVATSNLPYCWSNINAGTSTSYSGYPIIYASATYAASGANSLRFYTYSPTGTYDDQIAVLPLIDPDLFPVNTLTLSLDARQISSTYPFTLVVGVLSNPADKTTFVPVDTLNVNSTSYHHYEIQLSGYTGSGNYIALKAPHPATSYNEGYVDNIGVEVTPSCLKPIDFTATAFTYNSIDLAWTEVGDATTWEIVYGPAGFTLGDTSGTVVSVTENPYTLNNLSPSTTYDIYLRSDCGGDYSPYAYDVVTVTTACTPINALPYTESFDSYGTGTSAYVPCWNRISTYSSTTNYPYINTTHYDGVGSLYFYAGSSGTCNIAVSPMFDESIPVNTLQTSFMWRAANATSRLEVGVMTNPTDVATFVPVDTIAASAASTWEGFEVSFDQYTGEGHYIAFRVAYNSTTGYGYLDSVVIDQIPTCPRPLHVTASNATTNSIDLSWDQSGTPNSWVIEYGPAGFTPGTGTEVTATTNPFTVTNLTPSTIYNFYVTADCGGGDTSARSFAASGTTDCAAISSLPYINNFDGYGTGTTVYPNCWGRINTYTSGDRPYVNSVNYAGTGSLYFYANSGTYNIAITPEFDATIPINTLQATFMYRAFSAINDRLIVGVMTNPTDASTFVPVDTVYPASTASTWVEKEVVFNGYTGNGHYIAFYNGNPSAICYSYLDNLNIGLIPSCPKPQDLHVVNATVNSIGLGWTEVGSATSWEIAYGAPGFNINNASEATVVTATSNPFTIGNLADTTVYEFYVRSACGGTDHSNWSNSIQGVTTMAPAALPYTADFGNAGDQWMLNNGSCVNHWMRGNVNNEASLFVTNNDTVPGYTISSTSVVTAQKLFTVGTCDTITVTFDVMVDGEGGYDYLKLFVAPSYTQFMPSTAVPGTGDYGHRDYSTNAYNFLANGYGTQSSYPYVLNKLTDTIHVVAKMPNPNVSPTSTSTALLALVWRNDASGGTQPPAIIQNLTVTASGSVVSNPTVATNAATAIAQTSATLNGTITNPDNVTLTAKGFEWKATTGGTYTQVTATGTTSGYSYNLTNLTPNTNYTYKAFITYNGTTVYGEEMTFTTLEQGVEPCEVPTGLHVTNVENEAIAIEWDANANVSSWNIQYRPQNGTWSSATSNTNSYTITGLTGLTTYEIQVQANCGDGNISDWSGSVSDSTTNVGVENHLQNCVNLYPNPAKEVVNVQCTMNNVQLTGKLSVFDVYGKLLQIVPITSEITPINVSSLADGMYFVRVTTEVGTVTKTFVKR